MYRPTQPSRLEVGHPSDAEEEVQVGQPLDGLGLLSDRLVPVPGVHHEHVAHLRHVRHRARVHELGQVVDLL